MLKKIKEIGCRGNYGVHIDNPSQATAKYFISTIRFDSLKTSVTVDEERCIRTWGYAVSYVREIPQLVSGGAKNKTQVFGY